VTLRRAALGALAPGALAGAALLANVPAAAHAELLGRAAGPPAAALLSGLRPAEAGAVEAGWRARGLRPAGRAERGGFVCAVMAGPGGG
jgi:hypothetical protein